MTATAGQPLLVSSPDVDGRPWQFLIDASRVSFGTMTSFASSPVTATSVPSFSTAPWPHVSASCGQPRRPA